MTEGGHGRVIDREGEQGRTGARVCGLDEGCLGATQAHAGIDDLCLGTAGERGRNRDAKWNEKGLLLHGPAP
jgi:hypothetical protein